MYDLGLTSDGLSLTDKVPNFDRPKWIPKVVKLILIEETNEILKLRTGLMNGTCSVKD